MADCVICNICSKPGRLDQSSEVNLIPSNVRNFQTERFTVWRCPTCLSLHSKEDIKLDEYYRYYPLRNTKLDIWARAAYGMRLKRLKREGIDKKNTILDYGCGNGLFVKYLNSKGYSNVVGYDPYVPEFSNKKILKEKYDVITVQDVIEHHNNPQSLMGELVYLLRPGGMICIGTPNSEKIDLLHPAKFMSSLHQPYHRHILSSKALIEMAKKYDLKEGRFYSRFYYDTLYPTINSRFLQTYIIYAGNVLDAAVEPPKIKMVLTSPLLLFYAFFGYFFSPKTEQMFFFHKGTHKTGIKCFISF